MLSQTGRSRRAARVLAAAAAAAAAAWCRRASSSAINEASLEETGVTALLREYEPGRQQPLYLPFELNEQARLVRVATLQQPRLPDDSFARCHRSALSPTWLKPCDSAVSSLPLCAGGD